MRAINKLLTLFLAVCLVSILQSNTAFAEGGSIMVNGTDILKAQDYMVSCGSGTAKYNLDTKTLTLDNAVIAGDALTYGVEIWEQGVTVELIGQSSIDAYIGIWSDSPFRIKGTNGGSLAIHASQNQAFSVPSSGIRIDNGGLTVQDAGLQITVSGLQDVGGYAIYICGGENHISNSRVDITMPVNLGSDNQSVGINATGADLLTISDNSAVAINAADGGIAVSGTLKISGSRLDIPAAEQYVVSCGNLEIINGAIVDVQSNSGVALGANENITVSHSTVNAISVGSNSLSCTNLAITDGSKLNAKGYWPAFFVGQDTVIRDSSVTTESTADVSIYSPDGNLEISGSKVTCAPASGCNGIRVRTGTLKMADSDVVSPGDFGVPGIYANGGIVIDGGTTEVGNGGISSGNNIEVGGVVTANGTPSYDNISSNSSGQVTFSDADYHAVDAAIAKAASLDEEGYTNFDKVEAAISAVVRGKDIREQDTVDGYAAAIESAIAALTPLPVISILEGADQTIVADISTGVDIRADGDFDKFVSVLVDGVKLAREHYTAAPGSTVITLKPEYVKTLAVGDHTVVIRFTNGQAQTMLTIKEKESDVPDEKPENPDEKPENPDEKPENPDEKPENPDEKPENPGGESGEPGDTSSNGQPQNPADGSSNDAAQKPTKPSVQGQGNNIPPKTGDHAPIGWLAVLMAVSTVGLAAGKRRTAPRH